MLLPSVVDPEPDPDWIRIQEGKKDEMQFSIKKGIKKFSCISFLQLLVIKTLDPDSMNQDPQHRQ
jgi:hypothetical protein